MSTLLFNAAFAFYIVGLFHSIATFATRKEVFFRIAIASQAVGVACHTVFLVALVYPSGFEPPSVAPAGIEGQVLADFGAPQAAVRTGTVLSASPP